MKNIEKKWMLFLLATFVTCLGIGHSLLKGTLAIEDVGDFNEDVVSGDVNCEVTDIELSEGSIEFDPSVLEYKVSVSDISNFEAIPYCYDKSIPDYSIETNISDDSMIIDLLFNSIKGKGKKYTITAVKSVDGAIEDNLDDVVENNDYTLIFIGIICILVLINIYRILKNKKRK